MNIYEISDVVRDLHKAKENLDKSYSDFLHKLRDKQKWWFSDKLFNESKLQEYIESFPANSLWRVGRVRTKKDDKLLESERPWPLDSLASFLTTRIAWRRYDDSKKLTKKRVKKLFNEFNS